MGRRLDWRKAALAAKRKRSITDEQEFLGRGAAARWLEQAEKREALRKKYKQASPRRDKTTQPGYRPNSKRKRERIIETPRRQRLRIEETPRRQRLRIAD